MTEAEWLIETNPKPMLEFVRGSASDRKLQLFMCACCRRAWHLYDSAGRNAVEVTERVADGLATKLERRLAFAPDRHRDGGHAAVCGPVDVINVPAQSGVIIGSFQTAIVQTEHLVGPRPTADEPPAAHLQYNERFARQLAIEWSAHAAIVRDLFSNHFRHATVDPRWLTSTVLTLGTDIYRDRVFERLPILADALQDAGCDNEDILNHCRQPGEHVRGCWVVDLILGKT